MVGTESILIILKARDEATKVVSQVQQKLKGVMNGIRGSITKASNALEGWFNKFDGWAMSLMFFGMAIQKTFNDILKKSTKTFQEISHSVEGTATVFDVLGGSVKFLGFLVGDAISSFLEPLMPVIAEIVDKLGDWISKNSDLVANIVLIGLAIGTILMNFGMLWLGIKPIIMGLYYLFQSRVFLPLIAIGTAVVFITDVFNSEVPKWVAILGTVAMMIVLIAALIAGGWVGALAIAIAAMLAAVVHWREKIAMTLTILAMKFNIWTLNLKKGWHEAMYSIGEDWIKLLNYLIDKYNSFASSKLGKFFGFGQSKSIVYAEINTKSLDAALTTAKGDLLLMEAMQKRMREESVSEDGFIASLLKKVNDSMGTTPEITDVMSEALTPPKFAEGGAVPDGLPEDSQAPVQYFFNINEMNAGGANFDELAGEVFNTSGVLNTNGG